MGQVGQRLHRIRGGRGAGGAFRGRPGLAADPVGGRRRHHPQRLSRLCRRGDVRAEAGLERRAGVVVVCGVRQRVAGTAERPRADPGRVLRGRDGHRRRHHPEGLLRSGRRRTPKRSGLAAVPSDRRDESGVLRAACAPPDGPLRRDARGLRTGQGQERQAWAGQPQRPVPQGDLDRGRARPVPSSPIRSGYWTSVPRPTARRR